MLERRNPTAAAFESVSDRRACWRRSSADTTALSQRTGRESTPTNAGFWMRPPAPRRPRFRDAAVLAAAGAQLRRRVARSPCANQAMACLPSPESTMKQRNLRTLAVRAMLEQPACLQRFSRRSRATRRRLKIVVSPVRFRPSPTSARAPDRTGDVARLRSHPVRFRPSPSRDAAWRLGSYFLERSRSSRQ